MYNSIEFDTSTIKNAYETFQKQNNKGVLSQLEKKINKKLKSVAAKFNKLYFIEDAVYSFKIDLESERIFFSLFRGEQAISLDYQSTGFKWFFNLFFNLLNSTDLNPGDIIIMDEPSSALDPIAEYELNRSMMEDACGKTVIFISHRLSTTRMADRIYMFSGGEIIETGNHDELMAKNGKYAEMFRIQAEKYKKE